METDRSPEAWDRWHRTAARATGLLREWHLLGEGQLPDRLEGLVVLEVGAGAGAFAVTLAERGASEVVATDISPSSV